MLFVMVSHRRKINCILSASCLLSSIFSLYILLLCSCRVDCYARDTLKQGDWITDDGETNLVSIGGRFELGFFNAAGSASPKRYVGIWYHEWDQQTIVWVANRDKPVYNGSTGVSFGIAEDGNLQVWDNTTGNVYWTAGVENSSSTSRIVKLMDSGNLVLSDDDQLATSLWESFQHPTDTFLPGMKMDASLTLTSWIGDGDLGSGNFMFKQDLEGEGHYVISRKPKQLTYWKSSMSGNFLSPDEMPITIDNLLSNFSSSNSKNFPPCGDRTPYYCVRRYPGNNRTTAVIGYKRLVMNYTGELQYYSNWSLTWREPADECSTYNACGNFGSCNINNRIFACKCLPGFQPTNPGNWNSGNFMDGCTRNWISTDKSDMFLNLKMMKVSNPDSDFMVKSETECRNKCLNNSQCLAYSYEVAQNGTQRSDSTTGTDKCWIWTSDLSNLQEEYTNGGRTLSVRVAKSFIDGDFTQPSGESSKEPSNQPSKEPSKGKVSRTLIVMIPLIIVFVLASAILCIHLWRRRTAKRQEKRSDDRDRVLRILDNERHLKELMGSGEFREEDEKGIDVPFFDLESILAATDSFSDVNKLGQGGYGPVYKGTFPGGQEIAVKRLSSISSQGLQEFKNEVVLIAKLQHRNLVRLQGYCIKGDEKILLYEYMPNKSLDSFLFDQRLSICLDWEMRINIILGIARGLLYLHHDSRLRIIHRDLKTSNILLDEEMNPKISDFGLARIVGGKETEANTTRVVGTYGYMSPEYAQHGIFSVKSDVFSFGVVLLEIICGKKNTEFYQSELAISLIGYVWRLWVENKVLDLMDQTLREVCNADQFMKFVNIGLLCVQEDPNTRPTMSNVVTMLDSEATTFPTPKQPGFVPGTSLSSKASSSMLRRMMIRYTYTELTSSLGGR